MTETTFRNVELKEAQFENETYYFISNSDRMRPFFMSIVSDSNHWMFIGSNGGISAGRKNSDYALFPYYTDDKIIESAEITGSKSIFNVTKNGKNHIWEPFSIRFAHLYSTTRNLYKNVHGNKILFEEINHDLGLAYRYQWNSSDIYGFVKKVQLTNNTNDPVEVKVLDGIQNIMPSGVGAAVQNSSSNLVDAYKRNELIGEGGIGIFALSSIIVDKAEPSEALKANIAWSAGMDNPSYLLSSLQLDSFRKGLPIHQEKDVKAEKGAYFVFSEMTLNGGSQKDWMIVANVNLSISAIVALSEEIKKGGDLAEKIQNDIDKGTRRLLELNAAADALQLSEDKFRNTRHYSNTLFNIMRGGIFDQNYLIEKNDLYRYLANANKEVAKQGKTMLDNLPEVFSLDSLTELVSRTDSTTLKRLCLEYLPLKFSRRHGDPSRPWNQFSINTTDENDGSKILDYEGNWRDIFQNWEALAYSYPEFSEGMIFRFLNASTFDGYNPYRITKNGIDWERIEEDDPWSYIGYWGDHQIIYLLKFLEFTEAHYPGKLSSYFNQDLFVYANVPYKIKSYPQLLANPKDTIDFDHKKDEAILSRISKIGADGALLSDKNGDIYQVNFIEKILATVLAKMSNFIPDGGIWMNTQRPEWNDANNALVGNGVSMVTLYYLIRFLKFFNNLLENTDVEKVHVSAEVNSLLEQMHQVLSEHRSILSTSVSDKDRKKVLDGLGSAASSFREKVYSESFDGRKSELDLRQLKDFNDLSLQYLIRSLQSNKRADKLYHAYNLMSVNGSDEVSISYLSEMLEGQVSVLSSGLLSAEETADLLDAMKSSKLYREDQNSYLLYPEKTLPGFMEKNNIPAAAVAESPLLKKLVEDGNRHIIEKDIQGTFHFNGNFRNAADLEKSLNSLSDGKYGDLAKSDKAKVLQIFEAVFNHKAFTGRSGTFYGYEGLGSIYWHMVSKLLLAVQECCLAAIHGNENKDVIDRLITHYYEILDGIGVHKSPELYGAFPTDPYSHTPKGKGAQQPGMTGQVKEDILCRIGELGIEVDHGKLRFNPRILKKEEFLSQSADFEYIDINQNWNKHAVEKGCLCFTYCQVPVIYKLSSTEGIRLNLNDGSTREVSGLALDQQVSKDIFERNGMIASITVEISPDRLLC
ncbi:hypothetical protein [Fulvivirga sedimenti]|uniref:Cellobiose phosphorylase n=1 Tax=Fulvivirga sedimenti TaxID=2879465 RepID=A0A9X1HRE5_9BACT|nr:hypothetical protein [Fulvivirga sedimenti]MCA6074658.1 hypothetical protein [Fulvivirga sedimenti]MCA6075835.1 hypothetical protein [Fulvivirga sedimenti]MCA6076963.1 hypothetical protein [Fulvivirga sedimenti]